MGWLVRYLCNWLGGMLAATAIVLVYVYLAGAPHLPRLPIIGLPETYVAVALILAWSVLQLWVSLLGVVVDGMFSWVALRRPPGAKMALGHGFLSTAVLLLLAWYYEPDRVSTMLVVLVPLAVQGSVRLLFGRVPDGK